MIRHMIYGLRQECTSSVERYAIALSDWREFLMNEPLADPTKETD